MTRHYFDWAASAPGDYEKPFEFFGNPSSLHRDGREAKSALEDARSRCAAALGVPPGTLYFTSGGSESNCIAVQSNLLRRGSGRVIATEIEHLSILENLRVLERLGKPTGKINVDSFGRVNPSLLEKALSRYKDVCFAAIMAVNNETGAVADLASLKEAIANYGGRPVHLHSDIVQAAGKIPLSLADCGVDSASLSAHKLGGPRGIGLLYLRKPIGVRCNGGGQEKGIRPGTENVSGALAFASCLEKRLGQLKDNYDSAKGRCEKLLSGLMEIKRCSVIPENRDAGFSPYIVQAGFSGVPGEVMVRALDELGFSVSTGSACSASKAERHVLRSMGVDEKLSSEGIRISQGWTTTEEEIDLLLSAIREALKFL
jgi:cysteine desulfurase